MSKKLPTWFLSDNWAVGRNTHNWILYHRSLDDIGDPTKWKAIAYYRDPQQLLESLHREILRTTPAHFDLIHHLEVCVGRAKTLTSQLYSQIHSSDLLDVETASDTAEF
jgi:hypothetical protein